MIDIRLIFCKGLNWVIDPFAEQMKKAADVRGIKSWLIDTEKRETYSSEEFYDFVSGGKCAAVFFNQIGLALTDSDGENFWEKNDIPVWDIIQDHPRNLEDAFVHPIKGLHVVVPDMAHKRFIEKWYKEVEEVHLMPNGGEECISSNKPISERQIDVLYVGSNQKNMGFSTINWMKDDGRDFYVSVINYMLENTSVSTEDAVDWYLKERGVECSSENLRSLYFIYAPLVEERVLHICKLQAMQAIDKLGLRIRIIGDNWIDEQYPLSDRVEISSRITHNDYIKLIGDSKIHLNCSRWYKNGSVERVYNAMLGRAVAISDTSVYLRETLQEGKQAILFDYNNLEQLTMDVKYLMEHMDVAQIIADNGYMWAAQHETWGNRLDTIFNNIEESFFK